MFNVSTFFLMTRGTGFLTVYARIPFDPFTVLAAECERVRTVEAPRFRSTHHKAERLARCSDSADSKRMAKRAYRKSARRNARAIVREAMLADMVPTVPTADPVNAEVVPCFDPSWCIGAWKGCDCPDCYLSGEEADHEAAQYDD